MNLNKLRGNVGWLFKLQPPAIHLDPLGVNPLPPVEIEHVPVSFEFLRTSGIQQKLEAAGFEVNGVVELRLAELEMQGWERVVENDKYGKPRSYYLT